MTLLICINCTHAREIHSRHPQCAHPSAPRDPVTGRPARSCMAERDSAASYCGPDGDGYWPSAHVGKPGVDGVGQPVNGV